MYQWVPSYRMTISNTLLAGYVFMFLWSSAFLKIINFSNLPGTLPGCQKACYKPRCLLCKNSLKMIFWTETRQYLRSLKL